MKPNRRKAVVSDPIKRIGLNGGNSAREIVIQIARALGFKIHEDNKGVSAYGGNSIRIADHCTYMQTWVDNGTWNAPIRLDVVIEDEPTEAVTQVSIGYDFGITEFVSQSNDIDPQKARIIAYDVRNTMNGNPYANNVRGERHNLVATHDNNPQQINCNTNMNKKLIRLTESDLHRIVKESVNRILSEIDLIPNQSGGMRIADLKEFDFYIGNTRAGSDVVASNEGIFVDDELVNTYDPNVVINEPHDLIEAIDDAISFCPSKYIRKRDRDELGCYLGASLSIKDWWKENYG